MSIVADDSERDVLLAALQAYGQSFLGSFGSDPGPSQPQRKRRKLSPEAVQSAEAGGSSYSNEDEWHGFSSSESASSEDEKGPDSERQDDAIDGPEIEDDEFRSDQMPDKQPEVVYFSDFSKVEHPKLSKQQAKLFMSSKVSKLREDITNFDSNANLDNENDLEEERTNIQNDALLHKLVHTQLLSGSANSEMDMSSAQRRKALQGRILELASGAKLGKGESLIRQEERRKAGKSVRMGLERKVEERKEQVLEQAKNLGNYHQSIKHVFEASSNGKSDRKKRVRGLKHGVGKFKDGILKLSRDDIASIQGSGAAKGKGMARKRRK